MREAASLPAEAAGFYATRAGKLFLDAWRERKGNDSENAPYFLLLDEMNLSRPEHYGADLLSSMEVPDREVIQLHRAGKVVPLRGFSGASHAVPAQIGWPENLLVVGTVNVDETTFSFAPKVLDRAALLELVEVNNDILTEVVSPKSTAAESAVDAIKALNVVLRAQNLHIAYRAAKEFVTAVELDTGGGLSIEDAIDNQILNKVLPRIRGPRAQVVPLLEELQKLRVDRPLREDRVQHALKKTMKDLASAIKADDSPTSRKLEEMKARANNIGFTSFFG